MLSQTPFVGIRESIEDVRNPLAAAPTLDECALSLDEFALSLGVAATNLGAPILNLDVAIADLCERAFNRQHCAAKGNLGISRSRLGRPGCDEAVQIEGVNAAIARAQIQRVT